MAVLLGSLRCPPMQAGALLLTASLYPPPPVASNTPCPRLA